MHSFLVHTSQNKEHSSFTENNLFHGLIIPHTGAQHAEPVTKAKQKFN